MVNRSIQSKILKIRRRNRFAILSGAASKANYRVDHGKYADVATVKDKNGDFDQVPTGKHVKVLVGPISLSKAVINTGRGPDAERMQSYYNRIAGIGQELPKTKGLTEPQKEMKAFSETEKFQVFILGAHLSMHINYYKDDWSRLDLFINGRRYFWVQSDFKKRVYKRSEVYPHKAMAETVMSADIIKWVEIISP